jgi:exonuclease SbcC
LIDGQRYDRLRGADLPEELQHFLKMPTVKGEANVDFNIHFGEQKTPVFLLDRPPTQIGQFFASSSDAAYLVAMQKLHTRRAADARGQAARIDAHLLEIDKALAALAPSQAIGIAIDNVTRQYQGLQTQIQLIQTLRLFSEQLAQLQQSERQLQLKHKITQRLASPPPMYDTRELHAITVAFPITSSAVNRLRATAHHLALLSNPPKMSETNSLSRIIQDIDRANILALQLNHDREILTRLVRPPQLAVLEPMRHLIQELRTFTDHIDLQKQRATQLAPLVPPPILVTTQPIAETIQRLHEAKRQQQKKQQELKSLNHDLASLQDEWKTFVDANPDCPTCGQRLPAVWQEKHAESATPPSLPNESISQTKDIAPVSPRQSRSP